MRRGFLNSSFLRPINLCEKSCHEPLYTLKKEVHHGNNNKGEECCKGQSKDDCPRHWAPEHHIISTKEDMWIVFAK